MSLLKRNNHRSMLKFSFLQYPQQSKPILYVSWKTYTHGRDLPSFGRIALRSKRIIPHPSLQEVAGESSTYAFRLLFLVSSRTDLFSPVTSDSVRVASRCNFFHVHIGERRGDAIARTWIRTRAGRSSRKTCKKERIFADTAAECIVAAREHAHLASVVRTRRMWLLPSLLDCREIVSFCWRVLADAV